MKSGKKSEKKFNAGTIRKNNASSLNLQTEMIKCNNSNNINVRMIVGSRQPSLVDRIIIQNLSGKPARPLQ